jgi:uncharacterized protein (TIGR02145 family)
LRACFHDTEKIIIFNIKIINRIYMKNILIICAAFLAFGCDKRQNENTPITPTPNVIPSTVTSANGKVWMDRNLGASRVATSSTDTSAYGDLYQWGRAADQHQLRKSTTIATQATTDNPGNANFIMPATPLTDWRNPQNINLWQGVNGINNPCPTGFRLPTEAEWNAELSSWTLKNGDGAYASPLKLTVAGSREIMINNTGISGSYWSSTVSGDGSRYFNFSNAGAFVLTHNRVYGGSIRCIKN